MIARASAARADLYLALAEALAEPAPWMADSGQEWPLFSAALQVTHAEDDSSAGEAVVALAAITPEGPGVRAGRYQALQSRVSLYESLALEGRLAGPATFALWSIYSAAGLSVAGSEMPDHISVELAFLAYLMQQELAADHGAARWRRARQLFVRHHAGRWIPALGESLARSHDPVYGPIGRLLAAAILGEIRPRRKKSAARRLPALVRADACNLCSFCVQVCPTRTLAVTETDDTTSLVLTDAQCVACGRCVKVCPTNALQLDPAPPEPAWRTLVQSPRAHCPRCGRPTVSQAELQAVAERIGSPAWLDYCQDCRSLA